MDELIENFVNLNLKKEEFKKYKKDTVLNIENNKLNNLIENDIKYMISNYLENNLFDYQIDYSLHKYYLNKDNLKYIIDHLQNNNFGYKLAKLILRQLKKNRYPNLGSININDIYTIIDYYIDNLEMLLFS